MWPTGSCRMSAALEAKPAPVDVEVFWRPGCPFCAALRADLVGRGIDGVWRDIWVEPDAAAVVRSVNGGNETVPTVRVGDSFLTNPTGAEVSRALLGRPGTVAYRRRAGRLKRPTAERG